MNILDPRFVYVPAAKTDIRRTFARERRRLAALAAPANDPERTARAEAAVAAAAQVRLPARQIKRVA